MHLLGKLVARPIGTSCQPKSRAAVSLHWAMLVAQFFIIRVFELSPRVSWIALVALVLAIALVYALRLKSGRWRDPEVLETVMAE